MEGFDAVKGNVATAFLDRIRIVVASSGWMVLRTYSNGNGTTFIVVSRAVLAGQAVDVVVERINAIPCSGVYATSI